MADSTNYLDYEGLKHYDTKIKSVITTGLDKKLDKTGGTIGGSLIITNDLTVNGTQHINDTENLNVKNAMIYSNADGATLATNGGIGIKKNTTDVYGIVYDPTSDSVKLGLGKSDENGNFTFNTNEGEPVAVRDDSSKLTNNHIIKWDGANYKLVDSGFKFGTFNTIGRLVQYSASGMLGQSDVGLGSFTTAGGIITYDSTNKRLVDSTQTLAGIAANITSAVETETTRAKNAESSLSTQIDNCAKLDSNNAFAGDLNSFNAVEAADLKINKISGTDEEVGVEYAGISKFTGALSIENSTATPYEDENDKGNFIKFGTYAGKVDGDEVALINLIPDSALGTTEEGLAISYEGASGVSFLKFPHKAGTIATLTDITEATSDLPEYVKTLSGTANNGVITNLTKSGNVLTVTSTSLANTTTEESGKYITSITQDKTGKITSVKKGTPTDTNTAHSHTAGTGLSVSGSGGISGTTTYSLKTATSSEIGGIQIGFTETTKDTNNVTKVPVSLSDSKAYVAITSISTSSIDALFA